MKNHTTVAGMKFEAFNSSSFAQTKNRNVFEVTVNPATGYIKFSEGLIARRPYKTHTSVRFYITRHAETNKPIILARFVSSYGPSARKGVTYKMIDKDKHCKGGLRSVVYAPALFEALGLTEEQKVPFVAEPLLLDDAPNDVIFMLP